MGYTGGKGVLRHAGAGFLPAIVDILYQHERALSRRKRARASPIQQPVQLQFQRGQFHIRLYFFPMKIAAACVVEFVFCR